MAPTHNGGWHHDQRDANEQTGITPIAEGTNRLSAGEPDRLHPVSASFGDEADGKKQHIRLAGRMRGLAPATVDGTDAQRSNKCC